MYTERMVIVLQKQIFTRQSKHLSSLAVFTQIFTKCFYSPHCLLTLISWVPLLIALFIHTYISDALTYRTVYSHSYIRCLNTPYCLLTVVFFISFESHLLMHAINLHPSLAQILSSQTASTHRLLYLPHMVTS